MVTHREANRIKRWIDTAIQTLTPEQQIDVLDRLEHHVARRKSEAEEEHVMSYLSPGLSMPSLHGPLPNPRDLMPEDLDPALPNRTETP